MAVIDSRPRIGGVLVTQSLDPNANAASFRLELPAGPAMLETCPGPERLEHGACYVQVRAVE